MVAAVLQYGEFKFTRARTIDILPRQEYQQPGSCSSRKHNWQNYELVTG